MIQGLAFAGKICSGKDYSVEYCKRVTAMPTVSFGWADALKREVLWMVSMINYWKGFDVPVGQEVQYVNEHKADFRTLLQGWSDYRKATEGEDYWTRIGSEWLQDNIAADKSREMSTLYLNSDTRFPLELVTLKSFGIKVVYLVVDREKQLERLKKRDGIEYVHPSVFTHNSETGLDNVDPVNFDYIVDSNGTLDEMYASIREILMAEGIPLYE